MAAIGQGFFVAGIGSLDLLEVDYVLIGVVHPEDAHEWSGFLFLS